MEQNSLENNTPEVQSAADQAANTDAPATPEQTTAPTRRRASRRVTAAAGEPTAAPVVSQAEPAEAAAPEAASAADGAAAAAESGAGAAVAEAETETEAPKKRVSRARKKADTTPEAADAADASSAGAGGAAGADAAGAAAAGAASGPDASEEPPAARATTRRRQSKAAAAAEAAKAETSEAATANGAANAADGASADSASAGGADADSASADSAEAAEPKRRTTRSRGRKAAEPAAEDAAEAETTGDATTGAEAGKTGAGSAVNAESSDDSKSEATAADGGDSDSADSDSSGANKPNTRSRSNRSSRSTKSAAGNEQNGSKADNGAGSNNQQNGDADKAAESGDDGQQGEKNETGGRNSQSENQPRSSRTRQRERKRRGHSDDEPEITEDDVLLPIAGILDVLDNYAFVRTSGYLPGTGDVYVSLGQVKKYGMRKGDAIVGAIRQPRENESGGRQKYNAIVKVDSINSKPVEEQSARAEFADFTPIYANERLRLETEDASLGARVIDLFAPIGKGQRGLIIGQHESGKSTALQQIAQAVSKNQPDAHLMMVLIDERPEEVTALQRTVNGEVIASTFDRPAEDHVTVVELAVERAKRLVELGHDVVMLIDSLTDLARAYNLGAPAAVRAPAGSLDAAAVYPVKRVLSAARNIENGGSLTIIATLSAQPESRLDEALVGELEGVATMQLRLSGEAAERREFPAIDVLRSSTRNEHLLTSEAEAKVLNQLRRNLQSSGSLGALQTVLQQLASTSSNVEFLAVTQRQQG